MTCPICAWSSENHNYPLLFESGFWRVVLAPNQCLLGRCVIHLKRHAGDLAELTPEEVVDWLGVVKKLEGALQEAFGATLFNWSCYMNLAYREQPADPHVHWWAVPRYERAVEIGGWVFEDPDFGNPYDHKRWLDVPEEIRRQILERIS
jgi:diadenosine tetraphosphate (Ap4A) HIT family hydrolase